jgi:tetraprenyl-beta-curcumene synthase
MAGLGPGLLRHTAAIDVGRSSTITLAQLRAIGAGAVRELGWGLSAVRAEVAGWRARAAAIPDPVLRAHALASLEDKRALLDGAAFFWTLPDRRRPELLRLLIAFQLLANYHDQAGERAAKGGDGPAGSMRTLVDVIDLDRSTPAYYGTGPGAPDGGLLHALAVACREGCTRLPRYDVVHAALVEQVARARTLDLEHDPDPRRRVAGLRAFAAGELGVDVGATAWWEPVAGCGSLLTAIVLLALAAEETTTEAELAGVVEAYTWVATASTFLDNYVDQAEDARVGAHNYLAYYGSEDAAVAGVGAVVARALAEVGSLRHSARHEVLVASMAALYLSGPVARGPALRPHTRAIMAAGGPLTRLLLPVVRGWRIAYGDPSG